RGDSFQENHRAQKVGQEKALPQEAQDELGRPTANTKTGPLRIYIVHAWGGKKKYQALKLDMGNFSWGPERCIRKIRIMDVVYNAFKAFNNELVRTKTLVKNCIVLRQPPVPTVVRVPLCSVPGPQEGGQADSQGGRHLKQTEENSEEIRRKEKECQQGKLLACIASRQGQCGRAAGFVPEGEELEFCLRKIKAQKGK
uniref:40S ribosomal protein S8 n=1 Tax=Catagonus wagneri TaxID=51154 RepID=A0A8C3VRE8_9CETA